MPKFLKSGKVVVVLQGRFAGHKAVVVTPYDEGSKDRPFGHALVAGVARYPKKITKRMGVRQISRRSTVKPFVKALNYTHLMPTRYGLDLDLTNLVTLSKVYENGRRHAVTKKLGRTFVQRYKTGKNKWFFTKLRF